MRKIGNTLVVLGILLCMVMSLGVTADAAEGDAVIFAVSDTQLAPESIDVMTAQAPGCMVVDVNGLSDGQSTAGYAVVYTAAQPEQPTDYTAVWPGSVCSFLPEGASRQLVFVGVNETIAPEQVAEAISGYMSEDPYVIAMGPSGAAGLIGACADVDMFVTSGLDDAGAEAAAAAVGAAQLVNVGKNAETPVTMLTVNASAAVQDIPVPQPVADPGVAPVEQPADETVPSETEIMTGAGPAELPAGESQSAEEVPAENQPVVEDQPVVDAPVENEPSIEEPPVGDTPTEEQGAEEPEITYCKIIYDGNGRTDGMVPDVYDFIAGSTYFMAQNGYVRDGYEFAGWKIDDGETIYQPNDEVVIDHDVTVYAQWTEIAQEPAVEEPAEQQPIVEEPAEQQPTEQTETVTYTVTYQPGEGTGDAKAFSYNETDSKDIVLPDGSAFTAPEGKAFCGWLMDGTADVWEGNSPYTVTGDVTFVAQYKTVCTVTYDFGESPTEGYTDTVFAGESYGLAGEAVAEVPANMTFGGWLVNGELKNPGDVIVVNENITVTAQWNAVESEATPVPVTEITVTYKAGVEGGDGSEVMSDVTVQAPANGKFNLPECPFSIPADQAFVGWVLEGGDGTVLAAGSEVTTGESDMVFTAQWEAKIRVTVTYLPDNGTEQKLEEVTDYFKNGESVMYTLKDLPAEFTVPAGKTFGGWKIGDSVNQAGATVTLKENTTVTAVWNDVVKEKVDPAVDTDSLLYTQGSTDKLKVSFKAKIDVVSIDGAAVALNSQYTIVEDGDTSTIFFDNNYLNGLTVGNHTLNVTFVATDTTEYTPNTRTLTIKEDPSAEENTVTTIVKEWDRSQNLVISFAEYNRGNPIKLEINYQTYYKEAVKDRDYTINGTEMTIYPVMVNGWGNASYGFRVTFDGAGTDLGENTMDMNLKVTGTAATEQPAVTATPAPTTAPTAAPTATPNGPTAPPTGDNNNVMLYVVILVVLIIALAAVLIIVMKRRKR